MWRDVVYIDGRRDGYTPEQIMNRTYTVRELIDALNCYPDDALVMLKNDNGYTYGGINSYSFERDDFDDEEDSDDEEEEC